MVMTSQEIRQSFLDFFKSKNHQIVPSSPVIPQNDPTLLFINAGMNQFKDVFLGIGKRDYSRAADSQKCIRVSGKHNDLEQVGRDTIHHTFFEMLGNWSFGDYYKKEAIEWAWQLLTEIWKLPADKLYATVYHDDDEAATLWSRITEIDPDHIQRFGAKDNFWEMGETGPCGPCSEIHIDRGGDYCDSTTPGHTCTVNGDCSRFIELWNLVFIQYNRNEKGELELLPAKHVDTGAGFERIVSVLQNTRSNYATDLFQPIIHRIQEITGNDNTEIGEEAVAFRVLADHIRTLAFAIADGAIPTNEGRGYVLRRILRRAARFGRVLGMHEPFIFQLLEPVIDIMGHTYPELQARQHHISRVLRAEEESFGKTLDRGIELFEEKVARVAQDGERVFPGREAFLLYDTYGFPFDLTQLMAIEKGLTVDRDTFNLEMTRQKERSRAATMFTANGELSALNLEKIKLTEFTGYFVDQLETRVLAYGAGKLILSETPFYAEAGGQIGDTGIIVGTNFEFQVEDTKKIGDHYIHLGVLKSGNAPDPGLPVTASVTATRRRATERNHTATHLLHKALRRVLGDHVQQSGSLVHPDYLRFDFTHFEKVDDAELSQIEDLVNEFILSDLQVNWQVLQFDQAKERGAIALFGEKYGEKVRMIEIDDVSRELCGGTHVRATGEIGLFLITSETAVAAGIRRIEAITGTGSLSQHRKASQVLVRAAQLLSCPPGEVADKIKTILFDRRELEQEIKQLKKVASREEITSLIKSAIEVDHIKLVRARVDSKNINDLKEMADSLREQLKTGVGVLGTVIQDKVTLVCVVTEDLIKQKKLNAGHIIRKVAQVAGGSGGGNPHMALAGARNPAMLAPALDQVVAIVTNMLT